MFSLVAVQQTHYKDILNLLYSLSNQTYADIAK